MYVLERHWSAMMFSFKRRHKALEVSILDAHLQNRILVIYRRNITRKLDFLVAIVIKINSGTPSPLFNIKFWGY